MNCIPAAPTFTFTHEPEARREDAAYFDTSYARVGNEIEITPNIARNIEAIDFICLDNVVFTLNVNEKVRNLFCAVTYGKCLIYHVRK